jgi:predicted membrane-bound spermidine synthase
VHPLQHGNTIIVFYLEALGVVLYLMQGRPVRFGLAVAVTLLATPAVHTTDDVLARQRSFFGVHTVLKDHTRHFNLLLNGVTIHGAQHLDPGLRHEPTTFYHRHGPLGQLFQSADEGRFREVALVGLGTGSAVCHREAGRRWTIYEIDPAVVDIARDPRWFDFLAACAPDARIVLGDGRLSLARARDAAYDLIILDTFSSDSIPVHMITREAVALYFRKLTAHGVLMIHISNEYLDLAPVLERIAADLGLSATIPGARLPLALDGHYAQLESNWMALARTPGDLARPVREEGWQAANGPTRGRPWTDDYSNILQALK